MSDRTDPLSAALHAIPRLSDEALEALDNAVSAEQRRRRDEDFDSARWYTATVGIRGYRDHVFPEQVVKLVRECNADRSPTAARYGRVLALCGRSMLSPYSARPEGEPDCPACLRKWKRPS